MARPLSPTRRHLIAVFAAAAGTSCFASCAHAHERRRRHHHDHGHDKSAEAPQASAQDGPRVNCYLRGTHILTSQGDVAIEHLEPGDLVMTARAQPMPVRKVVRQPHNRNAPIRISRGAFGNSPRADLFVSPAHAIFIDGILIPAIHLLNGTSIVEAFPAGVEEPDYFHLELDSHEVIFAEGALAESLLRPGMIPYAPVRQYSGGRAELKALLRRLVFPIVDVRDPIQVVFDRIAKLAT